MLLFLCLHSSSYLDDLQKIGFVGTLFSGITLSWFALLLEKNCDIFNYDFKAFMVEFSSIFEGSNRRRVAEQR